jgi:cytochrome b6-f complex iron-sulfur subunit
MSCQHCVNRREFLAKSAAAAAALVVVEGCGDGQIGPTAAKPVTGTKTVTLSQFPALNNVDVLVDVGDDRALIRTGPSSFRAFSKICTHEGCTTDVRNNRFECPCHGSIFNKEGAVIRDPARAPLQQLTATFNATNGTVTIT